MKPIYGFSRSTDFFAARFRGKGSLSVHAKRLGYASPRLLEMVCQGTRLASDDFLFRAKNYLKLTDQEFLFLGLLVRRDRKPNPLLDEEIANFSRLALDQELLDEKVFKMVSDWQHLVLKQFFRSPRKISAAKIAQALRGKLSVPQVQKTLQTLTQLGVIQLDPESGEIRPTQNKGFFSQADVPSTAVRSHHRQMMARAVEAMEELPVLEREITAMTLSFNPANYSKVKNEIREFKNRIDARYGEERADAVYQLNIQFFPHIR
jgi:uncharacterized protein (TIGR02147 family)